MKRYPKIQGVHKEELWKIMWPKIKGRAIRGLPEHYKDILEEINRNKVI